MQKRLFLLAKRSRTRYNGKTQNDKEDWRKQTNAGI